MTNNWISVEEDLPPMDKLVSLWDGQRGWIGSCIGWRHNSDPYDPYWTTAYDSPDWDGSQWAAVSVGAVNLKPTHWHQLPDPREIESEVDDGT